MKPAKTADHDEESYESQYSIKQIRSPDQRKQLQEVRPI